MALEWLSGFTAPTWEEDEASGEEGDVADGDSGDDGSGGGDDSGGAVVGSFPVRAIFPPATPPNPFAGIGKGIVPRDPEAEKRTRAGGAILAEVVNSLMRAGEIVMVGPKQWRLNVSVAFEANRAPTVDDDVDDGFMVGQIWVNSTLGDVYILVTSTAGAAVWRGPLV